MPTPVLYRRRFIPDELIHLKDDIILTYQEDLIVTKWVTLHPRQDIARGLSAYYMKRGIKVSKIYNKDNQVVYWYCDIIQVKKDIKKNTVIVEDLFLDVILYEDGAVHIMDLDELSDALDLKLITLQEATYALRVLDNLLKSIYNGSFSTLQEPVIRAENT